jgi:hypothetical protein
MAKSPARLRKPNVAWFQAKIQESAYSQTEIATRIGLNKAGFSRMMSGSQQMTTEAASVLANILDESIVEVLKQADALSPGVPAARLETLVARSGGGSGDVAGARAATVYTHPSLGDITASEDIENRRLPRTDIVGWIDDEGFVHGRGIDSPTRVSSPMRLPPESVAYRFQTENEWNRCVVYVNADASGEGVPAAAIGQLCVAKIAWEKEEGGYEDVTALIWINRKIEGNNFGVKLFSSGNKSAKATTLLLKKAFPVLWIRQR